MVLQILINNFYNKAIKLRNGPKTKSIYWRILRADLKLKKEELVAAAAEALTEIEDLRLKESWIIEELSKHYD